MFCFKKCVIPIVMLRNILLLFFFLKILNYENVSSSPLIKSQSMTSQNVCKCVMPIIDHSILFLEIFIKSEKSTYSNLGWLCLKVFRKYCYFKSLCSVRCKIIALKSSERLINMLTLCFLLMLRVLILWFLLFFTWFGFAIISFLGKPL